MIKDIINIDLGVYKEKTRIEWFKGDEQFDAIIPGYDYDYFYESGGN